MSCRSSLSFMAPPPGRAGPVPPVTLRCTASGAATGGAGMLFGEEHVRRYVETDGREGHDWNGVPVLILTTTGRRSGQRRSTPLIYGEHDGSYLVVASKGGADEPPAWY